MEGIGGDDKRLFIETYGCQMNVADSEVVASVMKLAGYVVGRCGRCVSQHLLYTRQCGAENILKA